MLIYTRIASDGPFPRYSVHGLQYNVLCMYLFSQSIQVLRQCSLASCNFNPSIIGQMSTRATGTSHASSLDKLHCILDRLYVFPIDGWPRVKKKNNYAKGGERECQSWEYRSMNKTRDAGSGWDLLMTYIGGCFYRSFFHGIFFISNISKSETILSCHVVVLFSFRSDC